MLDPTPSATMADEGNKKGNVIGPEEYDIVKATQYGIYERCKELIDNGFDVNQRDPENITLLHWAAINCRKDLCKLYLEHGSIVDAVGGELHSTPLHWATRQGHLSMVVCLMKAGADATIRDGEGCTPIHLAAQFGYTPIVAYLLAKGISPDIQDKNGMTPLMWSCARIHNPDPTRLILTFGANTSLQEKTHQNTALHWAIHSKNTTALNLLIKRNACLDIPDNEDETPLTLLKRLHKNKSLDWLGKKSMEAILEKAEPVKHGWLQDLKSDKKLKFWGTTLIPFVALYLFGEILAADIGILIKLVLLVCVFVFFRAIGRLVCDDRFMAIFPISVYLATKFWMYAIWFVYIYPVVPLHDSIIFVSFSGLLWYNFLRAWRGDPGIIVTSKEERYQTVIDMAEEDGFDPKHFCTSCLVRKPVRSKHCSTCDKCVAKFDHHCPWLSNCVGWKNHKYFIGYLASLVIMSILFFLGALKFWKAKCDIVDNSGNFARIITCNSWVTLMTVQAIVHGVWVAALLLCQLYQILWLGVTTNERLNFSRYTYFGQGLGTKPELHGKKRKHVFNRSFWQNCVDFFELKCFRSYKKVDWYRTYAPISSHSDDPISQDTHSLLEHRANHQFV